MSISIVIINNKKSGLNPGVPVAARFCDAILDTTFTHHISIYLVVILRLSLANK